MNKKLIMAIIVSILLIYLITFYYCPVKADSTDFINFDSGITLYSPLNATYSYRNLALNLTIPVGYIHADAGQVVTNVVMNYSVDGAYNGSVFLYIAETQTHMIVIGAGKADLPALSDGSHSLTLYTYGLNMQNYTPQYKSYISTMYFSIDDPNSTFVPTPTPISTSNLFPSPSPTSPTSTHSPSPSPSPTVPEFPSMIILTLLMTVILPTLLVCFKKHRRIRIL